MRTLSLRGLSLRHALGRGGFAALQMLVLLAFLLAMIAAAMQGNATQRRYLMWLHERGQALRLAESGVEEALHRLPLERAGGAAERRLGRGNFRAAWKPAGSTQDVYEVVSTGWARTGEPETANRTVQVRAALTRSGTETAWQVRVLSWRAE